MESLAFHHHPDAVSGTPTRPYIWQFDEFWISLNKSIFHITAIIIFRQVYTSHNQTYPFVS